MTGAFLIGAGTVAAATGASATVPASGSTVEASARVAAPAAATSYHEIVNLAYNQCIEAPGGALNVRLRLADCNGSSTQKWAFVAASTANTYYIVNQAGGYCMEVNNGTADPGETVDVYTCNGTASERWVQSFRVVNAVVYQQFTHEGTTMCLDTVSGPGSQLMQWNCDPNNDAQTWLVK
ncbi:RICIN domain-containing protein [Streptomyces sp. NPDC002588]|uniref:RICIN domain-containing protein n=1 Tax=Streptomyces sp. NPDC002588 TaxID=3154419 RepID=UPI0033276D87